MTYQQHPLSAAFPAMSAEDFQALKDSVESTGVLNPITIYEDQVLDGWHRYQAAVQLGISCPSAALEEWIDPKDFVLAQNKNRRHITAAQLLAAASAVYRWAPAHRPNKSAVTAELTVKAASQKTGVSTRNVERFKEIEKKATPELMQSVLSGKTGLTKGAALAKLPQADQAAAITKPLPKLEATPPAIENDGMLTSDELVAEMQETQAENEQLQERVALMAKDDKAAEIDKLLTRINGLEGRLHQAMNQIKASEDTTKVHAALIHKLRKLLGVEGHKAIYAAVAALVSERAEA